MDPCDVCGIENERALQITMDGRSYTFDCFECAITKLALQCSHCGCRILGHGLEEEGQLFCCANCARNAGVREKDVQTAGRAV